uniref:F-box domain-containing protein n=1 Tax=Strongyloides papillosus TaxID=174720 RepID=A0A0N5CCV4_STREA
MDSSSDEKLSEAQNGIFTLPDDVFSLILPRLSWKDIRRLKRTSRGFYNVIHRNYHLINKRSVCCVQIKYDEDDERHPLILRMGFRSERRGDARVISHLYDEVVVLPTISILLNFFFQKTIHIQNGEELYRCLKMFDMRDLALLYVPVADNIDIFGILNKPFQKGTKIKSLEIAKLEEKDFTSFRTFVEKLSLINRITIEHVCVSTTEVKDIDWLLPLSSFTSFEYFYIFECHETRILTTDMFVKLLRNNPSLTFLRIGSVNIELLKNVFKEYFKVEQPRRTNNKCGSSEMSLGLYFDGEIEHLSGILRNCLSELENVEEAYECWVVHHHVVFGYSCSDKHEIKRFAELWDDRFCDRHWKDHHHNYDLYRF